MKILEAQKVQILSHQRTDGQTDVVSVSEFSFLKTFINFFIIC
jgi:hypothetical protein